MAAWPPPCYRYIDSNFCAISRQSYPMKSLCLWLDPTFDHGTYRGFLEYGYPHSWLVSFMENPIWKWMMTGGYPYAYDLGNPIWMLYTSTPSASASSQVFPSHMRDVASQQQGIFCVGAHLSGTQVGPI